MNRRNILGLIAASLVPVPVFAQNKTTKETFRFKDVCMNPSKGGITIWYLYKESRDNNPPDATVIFTRKDKIVENIQLISGGKTENLASFDFSFEAGKDRFAVPYIDMSYTTL